MNKRKGNRMAELYHAVDEVGRSLSGSRVDVIRMAELRRAVVVVEGTVNQSEQERDASHLLVDELTIEARILRLRVKELEAANADLEAERADLSARSRAKDEHRLQTLRAQTSLYDRVAVEGQWVRLTPRNIVGMGNLFDTMRRWLNPADPEWVERAKNNSLMAMVAGEREAVDDDDMMALPPVPAEPGSSPFRLHPEPAEPDPHRRQWRQ